MVSPRDALELVDYRIPQRGNLAYRIVFEEGWLQRLAYFGGKHHFWLVGNQIIEAPPLEHEVRYKANFIKPAVLRAVSKVLNLHGRFGVAPADSDMRARWVAKISDRLLDHLRNATGYDYEKAMAFLWAANCGTSFLKNTWDPNDGEPDRFYHLSGADQRIVPPQYLRPEDKRERDRMGWFEDRPTGEVVCEHVSPFQVYPDLQSQGKLEHCRWISQVQWLDREIIGDAWNVDPEDILVDESNAAATRYEEALQLMTSGMTGTPFGYSTTSVDEFRRDRAFYVQMWERPSRRHPKGRYIAAAGERLLHDGDNPFVGDRKRWCHLPFVKVDWVPMPGRFWGLSLTEDLISPQFRLNESRGRMHSFERLFGQPAWWIPANSGVSTKNMNVEPGNVYEYNPLHGKPEAGPPSSLPAEVIANASLCETEIAKLSAGSDIDATKLPAQLRSGEALRTVLKERDIVLTMTTLGALRVDRDTGRQQLTLAQMFYDARRVLRYQRLDGDWAIEWFTSADLSNDLHILGEPGEIETSDMRLGRLMDAVQIGAINPAENPDDRHLVLKALVHKTGDEALEDQIAHEEEQEREVVEILRRAGELQDQVYPVMPYEDDKAHMRALVREMTSSRWRQYSPEQQGALTAHYSAHQMQAQAKMEQQLQMMEALKGTPGAPGRASQPSRTG